MTCRRFVSAAVVCLSLFAATPVLVAQTPAGGQAQKSPPEVKPDNTYGEGGTRTVTSETTVDGARIQHIELRDKNGTVREQHSQTSSKDGNTSKHDWYDANGKKTQENGRSENYKTGEEIRTQATYKDDKQLTGDSWERKTGDDSWSHTTFNPATGKYEPAGPEAPPKHLPGIQPEDDLGVRDGLTLGGALIFEDSANAFITYGFDASYTHAIRLSAGARPEFGLMADVSWTRGTDDYDFTYGKLQALGGLEFCERAWGNRMYFGLHTLAGISRVRSEFANMVTDTDTSFAIAAGFDAGKTVSDRYDINVRVDYNPTFHGGDVQNNIRVAAGLRWRF